MVIYTNTSNVEKYKKGGISTQPLFYCPFSRTRSFFRHNIRHVVPSIFMMIKHMECHVSGLYHELSQLTKRSQQYHACKNIWFPSNIENQYMFNFTSNYIVCRKGIIYVLWLLLYNVYMYICITVQISHLDDVAWLFTIYLRVTSYCIKFYCCEI